VPDYWLTHGNPWEFPRPEVHTGCASAAASRRTRRPVRWVGTDDVLAMAYDSIIPGYGTEATNTLRLWSAKATEEIDLSAFNQGNYFGAVESKNHSENVSRVLYPDDSTAVGPRAAPAPGVLLRLRQPAGHLRRYLRVHTASTPCPTRSASTSTTPTRCSRCPS
jgi:starch phosphorylase